MNKSQIKSGAVLSYVSIAIQFVIQLIYTPLMLRLLGQSEYGVYSLVASFVSYLSLLSFGMNGAYLRFYSRYKVNDQKEEIARLNGMFLSIFVIIGIVTTIVGGILAMYSDQIFGDKLLPSELATAKILMIVLVINIAISFPTIIFDSIITAHEKFIFQRVLYIISLIANPFIALPFLLMGYKSITLVVVTTFISIVKLAVDLYYCNKKLRVKFIFGKFDFSSFKEIFIFSFFIFLNMIIDQLNWNIDKFILGRVSGSVSIAIYGVASQINSVLLSISLSVSSVFAPRINTIIAQNQHSKKVSNLFVKVGRIQFIIMALVDSGLIIFGKYFIEIWAGKEYSMTYYVTLLLVLPALIPSIQNLGIEIQRAQNKHKFRSVAYFITAIVNLIISIPLAIHFGPIGSALGTAIGLLVGNGFIMNWYYHTHMGLDMIHFWKRILRFIPSLILPVLLGIIIFKYVKFQSIALYILWILIYTTVYCLSMWFLGMDNFEKNLIREFKSKFKPRKKIETYV